MGFPGYLAPSPNVFDPSSIMSGAVGSGDLAFNTVYSGNIASGQVGWPHHASGSVRSGHVANTAVNSGNIASGQVGTNHLASGSIQQFQLGSGAVNSGHVSSGAVLGQAGGGAFTIASGTITTGDFASGAIIRAAQYVTPLQVGTSWTLATEEPISGVRAVSVSQSWQLRIAMASLSGRMPAIGIVVDNVASGSNANVYTQGSFQFSSGMVDFSGWLGKTVWVGRSGHLVQWSGSFNSGGLNIASGQDFLQRLGTIINSGSCVANVQPTMQQNQMVSLLAEYLDTLKNQFGV